MDKKNLLVLMLFISTSLFSTYYKASEIIPGWGNGAFAIKDNIALISHYNQEVYQGIDIYEISNPAFPVFISSIEIEENILQIIVRGNYAYILCRDSKLFILDIVDPQNPIIISEYETQIPFCYNFAINNSFAYINSINTTNEFTEVVCICFPENPFYVETFETSQTILGCALTENRYFITTSTGLHIKDITDPYEMVQIGAYSSGISHSPVIKNDLLYYSSQYYGLRVIDIHDPYHYDILTSDNDIEFTDVEIIDNTLYCLYDTKLSVVDISNLQSPEIINTFFYDMGFNRIAVKDNFAFTNSYYGWVNIIDISNDQFSELAGSFGGYTESIYLSQLHNIMVAYTGRDVDFYDISDPLNPQYLYSHFGEVPYWAIDTVYFDDYIACSTSRWRFYTYDPTNHEELTILSHTSLDYDSYEINVTCMNRMDNYMFVGSLQDGVQIIDISDLTDPDVVCRIDDENFLIYHVVGENDILYFLDFHGLGIYDISDAGNPVLLGFWDTDNEAESFSVYENYIYLTDTSGCIKVLDAINLTDPTLVNTVVLNYNSNLNIAPIIKDNKLIIADNRWNEIFIYDLTDPALPTYHSSFRWHNFSKHISNYGDYLYCAHKNELGNSILDISDHLTKINQDVIIIPKYNLYNYPNPFNPETTINFSVTQTSSFVTLKIYNIKGQKVKTLVHEVLPAGEHSTIWDGRDYNQQPVGSGLYFYKLSVNGKTETVKKCLLLK